MKIIFVSIVLLYTAAKSYCCLQLWENTCKIDSDCCSNNCYMGGKWDTGVCKKPRDEDCYSDTGICSSNEECCSKFCKFNKYGEGGVCSPKNEQADAWRGSDDDFTYKPIEQDLSGPILLEKECGEVQGRTGLLVTNGKISTRYRYPWHVGIYEFKRSDSGEQTFAQYEQICGGTLISQRYVITAAHCFFDPSNGVKKNQEKLSVVAGKLLRNYYQNEEEPFPQKRKIAKVHIPPKFNGIGKHNLNDIAVVVLEEKINYTKAVRPICLDVRGKKFIDAESLKEKYGTVAGWGLVKKNQFSEKLMETKLLFLSFKDCEDAIRGNDLMTYLRSDKFCGSGKRHKTNICQGDSGGGFYFIEPITNKYFLRGIASMGPSDCEISVYRDDIYALFTKMSEYTDFVLEHVRPQSKNPSSRLYAVARTKLGAARRWKHH